MGLPKSKTTRSEGEQKLAAPAISLPKGGGAIRGMGEKFGANPVTGTGSMSIPIATSPGRSGFDPQLSLSYDSGAGNGPFGLGWSLSLPSITRKTEKGLPQYRDAEESDVYILSGSEDLVPVLQADGSRWSETRMVAGREYRIHRYQPRIEGLFARIERWTDVATGEIHWRSITRDNVTTFYGKDNNSRIFDPGHPNPNHPTRIFSWLICQSYDDKGNAIVYEYALENEANVDLSQANERNRVRTANRYLKRIKYGNRIPNRDQDTWQGIDLTELPDDTWMFEVVFDYDEGHLEEFPLDPGRPEAEQHRFVHASATASKAWPVRPDPFSSYRAGFEVRTYRLCQRVLMFHHIPDLPTGEKGYDGLVRSTDFTYAYEKDPTHAKTPVYSRLVSVTQSGYTRQEDGRYLKKSLPPLEFTYSDPVVQDAVEEVDAESLENLPIGLDGTAYQWTDLHGEGIPGILTEQGGAWFYKRNLSPINGKPGNGGTHTEAKFAPLEQVATKPNLALGGGAQFMDLAGDGQPDLVVMEGPTPGLYEHDEDEGWQPFRPFTARLERDPRDPNLRFVDLDGDGHADVLITEDDAFVWHPLLAEAGFGPARRVAQALNEEKGPRLVFADGAQSIYLADLSGDGLTDLVRIRNGEVCYWPNLGYGRFGAKVTMDNAPLFDALDQFDQRRIRLADIDGTGTTDIIYLHRNGVRLYFNQSGNSWSSPQVLHVFLEVDNLVDIMVVDLLGNGTACLVWSSPLPGDAGVQMRYVNLMGGQKPHLLIKSVNNLGAETRVHYAPSTKFYLEDKEAGKPWITRLPFPVHVVERVETYDHISRNRFITRYAYHHGYFDGEEREFRGFGMVEQWDTEEYGALTEEGEFPRGDNWDEFSHMPPVYTKTWFHTGAYFGRKRVSRHYEREYYREPGLTIEEARGLLLPDTILPGGLAAEEEREACRALKGSMLRQEVYALDGTDKEPHPYTVTEQNFTIRMVQPRGSNRLSHTQVGNGTTATPEVYTYDAHGNMTSMPYLSQMDWDFNDQLQSVDLGGGGTAYYVYDASGERVRKVIERQNGTLKEERIYLGGFEIYRKYNGNGTTVKLERETLHIMPARQAGGDDKDRIALVETRTQGNDSSPGQLIRYQLGNHLGSVSLELDDDARIISYEEYSPYGSTVYQAVNKQIKAARKRYRFTGKERDEETGLNYHSARYYAPWLGRWVNCDPIDNENLYIYGRQNPAFWFDPSGSKDTPWYKRAISAAASGVSSVWSNAVEGSKIITQAISKGANIAGDWVQKKAEAAASRLRETGHPRLAKVTSGAGVMGATLVHTVIEGGGQILAVGPNIILGLHSAGTNIGVGAARIYLSKSPEETLLGSAQLLGGIGQGAAVTATVLGLSYGIKTQRSTNANPPTSEFKGPATIRKGEITAYRVYGGRSKPAGRYITPDKPTRNARQYLALPQDNAARYYVRGKTTHGTVYLEGKVAPGFNQPGGGKQIKILSGRFTPTQRFGSQMPGTTPRGTITFSIHASRRHINNEGEQP